MAIEVKISKDTNIPAWQLWRRIAWTKRNRIIAAAIGSTLIIVSIGLAWGSIFGEPKTAAVAPSPTPTATPAPTPVPKDHPDPLNGVLYTADEAAAFAGKRPVAVMVENHVLARPQSGLQEAEVLYEAMAEGGITRFMALYLATAPDKIGPVRSARLHFVEWAAEYDAGYAHWGGSAEALAFLGSHNRPLNLDEFKFARAFWRDYSSGKSLEHTGYTSIGRLRQVVAGLGAEQPANFASWTFKDDALTADRPPSQAVSLSFLGTVGYAAQFQYRPDSNDYARSTGGAQHVDAAGQQLAAKTIVLLYQQVTPYTDAGGHPAVRVQTIGSGDAVVIEDGRATSGRWSKASTNDRTILADGAGQPIPLNRGKIWIISVPIGSKVTY